MYFLLYLNSPYISGWPPTHLDLPASASSDGIKRCVTTTPGFDVIFKNKPMGPERLLAKNTGCSSRGAKFNS